MTGTAVNEKFQKKLLQYLYKRRYKGMIKINDFWKKHIDEIGIRNTLSYLSQPQNGAKDENRKDYIIVYGYNKIDGKQNGEDKTIDNTEVTAKITESGIKFYREFYRKESARTAKIIIEFIGIIGTVMSIVLGALAFYNQKEIEELKKENKSLKDSLITIKTSSVSNKVGNARSQYDYTENKK